ncbi:hypothetical protein F0562_019553 [Nyssa sinensis]|uniref:Enhancer of polycomb-like protein n=1 Tax=Nyssa sinensis TaxID=561372 RepID=A0A5J5BNL1_9ASTE|nr:hypothetical protein F0562_019553 [Nyssa sinensis]
MRAAEGDEWIELLDNPRDGGNASRCGENGWHEVGLKQEIAEVEVDKKIGEPNSGKGHSEKKRALEYKKFGIQFSRKQWRKKTRESSGVDTWDSNAGFVGQVVSQGSVRCRFLAAFVESSCSCSCWFALLLNLLLRYMRRVRVSLPQLTAFLLSEPLSHVFSSHGIHFLRDSPSIKSPGSCKIFESRCSIPLFADNKVDGVSEDERHLSFASSGRDSRSKTLTFGNDNFGKKRVLHHTVGPPKLANRTVQFRNGVSSRSIQKRRSSLRSRRGRNPSMFGHKANGALVSHLLSFKSDGTLSSPVVSNCEFRSSVRRNSTANIKELKSSLVGLTQDIDSTCCSANILVIESDKCYREEGAIITLEVSASKQWFLAVKRDGIMRYSLTAQKVMRPCTCNRVSHDIIWTEDTNSWKLEFPNRRDWLVFKELYRECSERNVQAPTVKTIPVPGVYEVTGYADNDSVPFLRPDSYISLNDDELSRALAKRTANYDMDSEDEEWLNKFNDESFAESELHEQVSKENFELIIDAFEKALYCSPDDYSVEKAAVNLCLDLERKEVIEAVYSYWLRKRKQKRTSLVRIFQCYQPKRAQLFSKPVIRKKRSFKRQASQSGRDKQRTLLQALAAKQDAFDEQSAVLKVQEAKAAASRSEGLAVVKRQRAQLLMENADLATYKATVALRIAEAARVAESAEVAAAAFFLH